MVTVNQEHSETFRLPIAGYTFIYEVTRKLLYRHLGMFISLSLSFPGFLICNVVGYVPFHGMLELMLP
jgi:hypothetical protein